MYLESIVASPLRYRNNDERADFQSDVAIIYTLPNLFYIQFTLPKKKII